jgi:hypothetical protein
MLSSVYNIAFLSVMTAFAVACGVLKWKRPHLSRLVVTSPLALGTALVFVLAGLLGNILRAPVVLAWFFLYFGAALSVVLFMFSATGVLQTLKRLVVACLPTEAERAAAAKKAAFIVRSHVAKEAPLLALGGGGGAAGGAPAMPLSAGSSSPSLNAEDSMQGALLEAYAAAMPGEDGCCEQDFSLGDMEESGIRFIREEAQEDEDIYSSSGSSGSRPGSSGGVGGIRGYLVRVLNDSIHAMNAKPVVYFAKHADLCGLNKAVAYVRSNEQTHRLVVVHCVNDLEARKALILGEEQQGGSRGAASVVATLQAGLPPSETQRDMIANVALLDAVYRALLGPHTHPTLPLFFLSISSHPLSLTRVCALTKSLAATTPNALARSSQAPHRLPYSERQRLFSARNSVGWGVPGHWHKHDVYGHAGCLLSPQVQLLGGAAHYHQDGFLLSEGAQAKALPSCDPKSCKGAG